MQNLRNFWNGLKALGTVIIIGAITVAIPILGIILAIGLTLIIAFILFLEYFTDNPKK